MVSTASWSCGGIRGERVNGVYKSFEVVGFDVRVDTMAQVGYPPFSAKCTHHFLHSTHYVLLVGCVCV